MMVEKQLFLFGFRHCKSLLIQKYMGKRKNAMPSFHFHCTKIQTTF